MCDSSANELMECVEGAEGCLVVVTTACGDGEVCEVDACVNIDAVLCDDTGGSWDGSLCTCGDGMIWADGSGCIPGSTCVDECLPLEGELCNPLTGIVMACTPGSEGCFVWESTGEPCANPDELLCVETGGIWSGLPTVSAAWHLCTTIPQCAA